MRNELALATVLLLMVGDILYVYGIPTVEDLATLCIRVSDFFLDVGVKLEDYSVEKEKERRARALREASEVQRRKKAKSSV